jgi:hypothetical protein
MSSQIFPPKPYHVVLGVSALSVEAWFDAAVIAFCTAVNDAMSCGTTGMGLYVDVPLWTADTPELVRGYARRRVYVDIQCLPNEPGRCHVMATQPAGFEHGMSLWLAGPLDPETESAWVRSWLRMVAEV